VSEKSNTQMNIERKVAVVTGGSSGIGLATVEKLCNLGFRVAFSGKTQSKIEQVVTDFSKRGFETIGLSCDHREISSFKKLVSLTVKTWGKIDVLVNNVGGISNVGTFVSLEDADWQESLNLNFMSTVRMIKESLPFLEKNKGSRIINVSSFVAQQPGKWNPHYSTAKAALLNLTKYLANELSANDILVNSVIPGSIDTEGWRSGVLLRASKNILEFDTLFKDEVKRINSITPLGRMGQSFEVAECIGFLASDSSSFITGTHLVVDGGRIVGL